MPIPSGDYIANLDPAQPPDSEAKKFGAGYLRFIAKVVEQSFPNITGAVTATHTQLNALLTGPTITSTDATAAVGPTLELYRNSASPAASDLIGEVKLSGEDSAGNTETYARAYGVILDPTSTSEDGELRFDTVLAGTLANRLRIGAGLYTPNASGGDKGIDTINATSLYLAGLKSGGLVAMTAIDVTGVSAADIVLDTTNYRALLLFFDALVVTSDGANLLARVSTDGGSSYLSTSTYIYARGVAASDSTIVGAGSSGDSSIALAGALDSTTTQNLSGFALLLIGGAAAHATKLLHFEGYVASSGLVTYSLGYGSNNTTSQVNAIRFLPSTSTFASGFIRPFAILK